MERKDQSTSNAPLTLDHRVLRETAGNTYLAGSSFCSECESHSNANIYEEHSCLLSIQQTRPEICLSDSANISKNSEQIYFGASSVLQAQSAIGIPISPNRCTNAEQMSIGDYYNMSVPRAQFAASEPRFVNTETSTEQSNIGISNPNMLVESSCLTKSQQALSTISDPTSLNTCTNTEQKGIYYSGFPVDSSKPNTQEAHSSSTSDQTFENIPTNPEHRSFTNNALSISSPSSRTPLSKRSGSIPFSSSRTPLSKRSGSIPFSALYDQTRPSRTSLNKISGSVPLSVLCDQTSTNRVQIYSYAMYRSTPSEVAEVCGKLLNEGDDKRLESFLNSIPLDHPEIKDIEKNEVVALAVAYLSSIQYE